MLQILNKLILSLGIANYTSNRSRFQSKREQDLKRYRRNDGFRDYTPAVRGGQFDSKRIINPIMSPAYTSNEIGFLKNQTDKKNKETLADDPILNGSFNGDPVLHQPNTQYIPWNLQPRYSDYSLKKNGPNGSQRIAPSSQRISPFLKKGMVNS